jgi:hypothetical protein
MVNLADQDTSFLVPCRHCGDLLPEQDRICPHCGKDQRVAPVDGGAGTAPSGLAPDEDAPDPFATARGPSDFTAAAGLGPHVADDGAARRRRKAIGIAALIAGVLLLGMAYDRYAKQRPTTPTPPPALAQEATQTMPTARPATATGPVVRTPSAAAPSSTTSDTTPIAATPAAPSATSPAAPATADTPASPCNEALAAMSLCARP